VQNAAHNREWFDDKAELDAIDEMREPK